MDQLYRFDGAPPPALTEALLRSELEKRRLRRETILVTIAAILTQLCLVLLAAALYPVRPGLALVCTVYLCLSVSGGGVLALVYTQQRRYLTP